MTLTFKDVFEGSLAKAPDKKALKKGYLKQHPEYKVNGKKPKEYDPTRWIMKLQGKGSGE